MPKHAAALQLPETPQDLKSRLSAEISHLTGLSKDQLRTAWAAEFRKPPPNGLPRDLLLRTLAGRLQEKAFGGHDAATLKLLKAFAGQDADKVVLFRKLKPGTTVIREYQGVRHVVTKLETGMCSSTTDLESALSTSRHCNTPIRLGVKYTPSRYLGLSAEELFVAVQLSR
ncbi:MAG TPA: DUF2924 domain-containing protein [Rhizomicrobium sp.]|jgi:hypothetical protein